ncbi:MAG: tetratricopeptide repeat protein [Isosphaeraceae bacterium]
MAPTRVEERAELASSLSNMGWVIASTGRKNEAREVCRRGVALLAQYRQWLSYHYMNLGKSLRALGRKDDTLAVSRKRCRLLHGHMDRLMPADPFAH